jgi:predicted transcriptional regulator
MINRIESRGRNVFIITEVGQLFLEEYKKFDDFAKSMGLEL